MEKVIKRIAAILIACCLLTGFLCASFAEEMEGFPISESDSVTIEAAAVIETPAETTEAGEEAAAPSTPEMSGEPEETGDVPQELPTVTDTGENEQFITNNQTEQQENDNGSGTVEPEAAAMPVPETTEGLTEETNDAGEGTGGQAEEQPAAENTVTRAWITELPDENAIILKANAKPALTGKVTWQIHEKGWPEDKWEEIGSGERLTLEPAEVNTGDLVCFRLEDGTVSELFEIIIILKEEPAAEEPVTEEPIAEEPAAEPSDEEHVTEEPAAEETAGEEPAEEPAGEKPVTEEPAAEEPAAEETEEEPAGEEPVTEESATEEPAGEEPAEEPAGEEPVTEEPATEEPVAEEPAAKEPAEEPAGEEPVTEEPAAEEPAAEEPTPEEPADETAAEQPAEDNPAGDDGTGETAEPAEGMEPVDEEPGEPVTLRAWITGMADAHAGETVTLNANAEPELTGVSTWQIRNEQVEDGKWKRAGYGDHLTVELAEGNEYRFVMQDGTVSEVLRLPESPEETAEADAEAEAFEGTEETGEAAETANTQEPDEETADAGETDDDPEEPGEETDETVEEPEGGLSEEAGDISTQDPEGPEFADGELSEETGEPEETEEAGEPAESEDELPEAAEENGEPGETEETGETEEAAEAGETETDGEPEEPEEPEEYPAETGEEESGEAVEPAEGEETGEAEEDSEDAAEEAPAEARTLPENRSAVVSISWDEEKPGIGSVAHFSAQLTGYEELNYTVQWIMSTDNENWTEVEGATGETMDIVVTEDNYLHYWRIRVQIEGFKDAQ